ncbi:MAG: ABC transporter substrate-binding protein [Woeseiaceae bacterium]
MLTSLLMIVLAQGVTQDSIVIGMEGPANSFSVDEENLGMHLVVRQVNDLGGIHGRRLQVVAYSRGRENPVEQAIDNARLLVENEGAFLLFNFGGPASVEIGKYAMANEVPYLFPHTALLTVDGERHVFTSFPRYAGESRAMFRYLATERGVKKIAVIHAPNIYGEYFRDRAESLAGEFGYEFVGAQALPNKPESAIEQMSHLATLEPDIVLMALYPAGARTAIEAKAALAWEVRLVSAGPLTDEQYLNVAGGEAEGTIGFCHYPDPNESSAPGIARYRSLLAKYFPGHAANRYSLYGYVFGQLVVEGLQRAGENLTRERFLDAMESIRNWDSGGILPPVSFSATDHHAQESGFICELEDGRFKPLSGWLAH